MRRSSQNETVRDAEPRRPATAAAAVVARLGVISAAWRAAASLVKWPVLLIRAVLLARWLPVDVFGVYALAAAVAQLSAVFPAFGLAGAFLHRSPETEDECAAAAAHFTLQATFTLGWVLVMAAGVLLLTGGGLRTALLVQVAAIGGLQITDTPRLVLTRRLAHRRLAAIDILTVLLATAVALGLAWQGATLWALLATDLVALAVNTVALYLWRPVWRPRLAWVVPTVRYFLRFGGRVFWGEVLARALERIDDLWTGAVLGRTALGFYSRAYTFASYPRALLAVPIHSVATGTYAALQHDRRHLSQAFFGVNAFLVRGGFLLGGMLAAVAPELVLVVLGPQWLPMVAPLRLMLVYALLDPLKMTAASLLTTCGSPARVARARLLQLVVLAVGLLSLGPVLGIAGVALAVDVMLVVGIIALLRGARAYVDLSPARLFGWPAVALVLGMACATLAAAVAADVASPGWLGMVKGASFVTGFGGALIWRERDSLPMIIGLCRRLHETSTQKKSSAAAEYRP